MTTATLEIYNALIEAGVSESKAEAAAKAVISRQEAKDSLASKEDIGLVREDMLAMEARIYKAMMIQSGATIAAFGMILALFSFLA